MAALFFIFVKTKKMCIESLVGLRDCEGFEPSTGLYIDDLGINTTFLGQLITDQYNNGAELFADITPLAEKWETGDNKSE